MKNGILSQRELAVLRRAFWVLSDWLDENDPSHIEYNVVYDTLESLRLCLLGLDV